MVRCLISLGCLLVACAAPALAQQTPTPQAPPHEDCSTAPHRALDFWLGQWDVFDRASNSHVGHSLITAHDDGCVIQEEWTGDDTHDTGRSLNMYDVNTGHW